MAIGDPSLGLAKTKMLIPLIIRKKQVATKQRREKTIKNVNSLSLPKARCSRGSTTRHVKVRSDRSFRVSLCPPHTYGVSMSEFSRECKTGLSLSMSNAGYCLDALH